MKYFLINIYLILCFQAFYIDCRAENDSTSNANLPDNTVDTLQQTISDSIPLKKDKKHKRVVFIDSLEIQDSNQYFSYEKFRKDSIRKANHSPRLATLYSTFVPGLGQIYNRKYWKAPIIWGGLSATLYLTIKNQDLYSQFNQGYRELIEDDTLTISLPGIYVNYSDNEKIIEQVEQARTFYMRNRNLAIIGSIGIYFLNVVDAMVDAHFFDYDVSDNLSLHIEPQILRPTYYTTSLGFKCYINF